MARTVDELLDDARAQLPQRPTPAQALAAQTDGALLIDIRGDDQRRDDGAIPDAVVIPRNVLEWRCDPASAWRHPRIQDHEQRLMLICNEGYQSSLAAAALQQLGLTHATDVDGGFVAWKAAGLPTRTLASQSEPPQAGAHWDGVYARGGAERVSWYQAGPAVSLELIEELGVPNDAAIIDIGGGASVLGSRLVERGYTDVTVLDVSRTALALARERARGYIEMVCQDVLTWAPSRAYDLWHDRAMFHFMVDADQQAGYVTALSSALRPGGAAIIATFAADGPLRCSGLPVARYSSAQLAAVFGESFTVIAQRREEHRTPAGVAQPFTWTALRRG